MSMSPLESGTNTVQKHTAQLDVAQRVLSDLYELLELYGPSWYTEKLRERMQSVLNRSHDGGRVLAH